MSDQETLARRVNLIGRLVKTGVEEYMGLYHPGVQYELEDFYADNDIADEWLAPLGMSLSIDSQVVGEALCDAGSDTVLGQAYWLYLQITTGVDKNYGAEGGNKHGVS